MNNKGQSLGLTSLVSVGVIIVVATMLFAFGADITSDVADDQITNTAGCNSTVIVACGYAYNMTQDGLQGIAEVPEKFPTLGKVVIAVIIIGLLIAGFGRLTGRI